MEEDQRLEIISKNGKTFFQPVSDRDSHTAINCLLKWEQAFRVYCTVFTSRHPDKASELLQYNHIIQYASQYYVWDNVYAYDKDFRLHLSRHPGRSWAIILQQAWTMRLQDRLQNQGNKIRLAGNGNSSIGGQGSTHKKMCWKFNKSRCMYGFNCKFDHRCGICNKFGHGAHNCRKGMGGKNTDREDQHFDKMKEGRDKR